MIRISARPCSSNAKLTGGSGADRLEGGPGNDVLDGNVGADVLVGGDDADQFSWNPGEASDTIDGGAGADRLAFNGANVSENLNASNVGGHVRFTRDVASIVMDLVGVETLDLVELGGADVLTVSDLTGTDLTTLSTDLAGAGGLDDGSTDEVRVPAGSTVGRDGAAAVVDGLGAQVRVRNGSGADRIVVTGTAGVDQLQVDGTATADTVSAVANGTEVDLVGVAPGMQVAVNAVEQIGVDLGDGDDQFSTTGSLAALTTLSVAGGDGRDTILGGNGADVIDGGPDTDLLDGNQGADGGHRGRRQRPESGGTPGDGSDTVDGGLG